MHFEEYEMKIISDTLEESSDNIPPPLSLKRGSEKHIMTYIANDFDSPLDGFKEYLFEILVRPLKLVMAEGDTLIFTNLPEAFFTYLKVAFLTGIGLASPVLIYQFWMFIAPGLYDREKRLLVPIHVGRRFRRQQTGIHTSTCRSGCHAQ